MGLLEKLRDAAPAVDSQFQPSSNEQGPLLAALVYYVEHGDGFLKAADEGPDAVTELLVDQPADDDAGKAKKGETAKSSEKGEKDK